MLKKTNESINILTLFRGISICTTGLGKVFPTLVENGSNPGEEVIENIDGVETKHIKIPLLTVNYIGMHPVILTKAIQEQQQII